MGGLRGPKAADFAKIKAQLGVNDDAEFEHIKDSVLSQMKAAFPAAQGLAAPSIPIEAARAVPMEVVPDESDRPIVEAPPKDEL
jgi:hypothetical protein